MPDPRVVPNLPDPVSPDAAAAGAPRSAVPRVTVGPCTRHAPPCARVALTWPRGPATPTALTVAHEAQPSPEVHAADLPAVLRRGLEGHVAHASSSSDVEDPAGRSRGLDGVDWAGVAAAVRAMWDERSPPRDVPT